jgi:hypothetical protein
VLLRYLVGAWRDGDEGGKGWQMKPGWQVSLLEGNSGNVCVCMLYVFCFQT